MAQTNFPAGTVIKIIGLSHTTFALDGTTRGATPDGETYLGLTTGGVVRPSRIESIVSVPTQEPEDRPDIAALTQAYNLALLRLAIAVPAEVEFGYRDVNGNRSSRFVEPKSVEDTCTGTILRAVDLDTDEPRTFRVDRIEGRVFEA